MVKKLVLKIDKPHFVVKLHKDTLEVDLKEGAKKHLEKAVEANPIIRESLGILFQTIIPLDVPLKDIESAKIDKKGQVKIVLPHRRDIAIPLTKPESKKLVAKLNELVPIEKQKELERIMTSQTARKERAFERASAEFARDKLEKTGR